jgi:hypothetical protein
MAFYADGHGEDKSEEEDTEAHLNDDVPEDMVVDATATDTATAAKKKKISKRTASYTPKEDGFLCQSWLAISQDAISGAEQKGKAYWRRVNVDYHEHRQLKPFKIHSDHDQVSIQKRWSLIQQETNKFCGAIEGVQHRPLSGTSMIDMVCPWPYVICPCAMPIGFVCCMCVNGHHSMVFVGSSCLGLLQDRT